MDSDEFTVFFQSAVNNKQITPYDYQRRLAGAEEFPALLDIPTGMGKTAAVILAWLWRRLDSKMLRTPRRLVYCLPMRVLVEQTAGNAMQWIAHLAKAGLIEENRFAVQLLMGGENEGTWFEQPEKEIILIGTQDMLLSRALMRGYGMSRYRWPVDFAWLHNDALWVYDEVQLMGAGLPNSAQLEAFRRRLHASNSRSLWASATLHPDWLATVDFQLYFNELTKLSLSETEKQSPAVTRRIHANKILQKAELALAGISKKETENYIAALIDVVLENHQAPSNTLVIVNSVERAQLLFKQLRQMTDAELLLIHARFRAAERTALNHKIIHLPNNGNVIIIATQAIEAGVDISAKTLITELAPWSSMVQRFGRCNRAGEHESANVFWIDIADDDNTALPYTVEALAAAREKIFGLSNAAPGTLPAVEEKQPVRHIIRKKDFVDLFNTDPDLTGLDIDISLFIRDDSPPQVQVFWRDIDQTGMEQPMPQRSELCPVSMGQIKCHLKTAKAWTFDYLDKQWRKADKVIPGGILMLNAREGGYHPERGFVCGLKGHVEALPPEQALDVDYSADEDSHKTIPVILADHLSNVASQARSLCEALSEAQFRHEVVEAGRWHDTGKLHEVFYNTLHSCDGVPQDPLAKSPCHARHERRYFRHELASMLIWLQHSSRENQDLIAYLILAHHGKVRTSLRAIPGEEPPADRTKRFARGVHEGDIIPAYCFDGVEIPQSELKLALMELGDGEMGPSWVARVQKLLHELGPFRLAWLESLVRIADWRASRHEQEK